MGLIRFLLACIVVLCHTSTIFGYRMLPSDFAVQIFFVLSGFYMSLVLNEKYSQTSNSLFYKNRALKIYPLYWLILMLLVIWGVIVNLLGYPGTIWFYQYASPSMGSLIVLIAMNLFIIGLDLTFVLGIKHGNLYFTKNYGMSKPNVYLFGFNSIGWTVGVELLFYLISPLILRKGLWLLIAILLSSLTLRITLSLNGMSGHPWDYMFFPTQLMYFMAGSISYKFYIRIRDNNLWIYTKKLQYFVLTFTIALYSYFFGRSYSEQMVLFLTIMLLIPAAFEVTKYSKVDKYLGELSYPIYISQMLIINITRANAFPKIVNIGFTTLLITIFFSIFLNNFISEPIERMRQQPFKNI